MSEQPLTYEGILELFRQADRRIKKTERLMKENARLMKERAAEYDRKQEEYAREKKERDAEYARKQEEYAREKKERDAENARRQEEYAREKKERNAEYEQRMRKTELAMERMCQEVGGLGNSIGRMVEHMIGGRILDKFQVLGYKVDHYSRNHYYQNSKLGISGEIDLILQDGDVAFFIEVKTTLETADVRKHLEKMAKYRIYADTAKILWPPTTRFIGAVADAVVTDEAKDFAHENGIYVIVQSGEAVEILPTPEGFKAKEW